AIAARTGARENLVFIKANEGQRTPAGCDSHSSVRNHSCNDNVGQFQPNPCRPLSQPHEHADVKEKAPRLRGAHSKASMFELFSAPENNRAGHSQTEQSHRRRFRHYGVTGHGYLVEWVPSLRAEIVAGDSLIGTIATVRDVSAEHPEGG